MRLIRAALAATVLLLAALAVPAAAACIEKGGYPFESGTDACLPGAALNAAIDGNVAATPPQNADGSGAQYGHRWLDSSTTPNTIRVCNVSQCTAGVYHSSEWATLGWLSPSDNYLILNVLGSPIGNAAADNLGISVVSPGTGTLETVLPVQSVTGASKTFATADLFLKTRRSNAGAAMTDTLPAASAMGMVNGARVDIANVDPSASDSLTAGSGTSIAGGCATIPAGRDVMLVYDLPNTTWRGDANSCSGLLAANNLSDLANAATARSNLGLGGFATLTPGTLTNNDWCTSNGTTITCNTVPPLLAANNLSDLANAATARSNLGLGGFATLTPGTLTNNDWCTSNGTTITCNTVPPLLAANNLSDLANAATARSNLGLGSFATLTPGTLTNNDWCTSNGTTITCNTPTPAAAQFLRSYLAGLTLANDGGTPNSVLDIAAGLAADSTNAAYISLGAFTKSTAGAWASGSGANGMGNGLTIAAATWYQVCLANNGGTPDIWFDTTACTNRPSGISDAKYRPIGYFRTDASAHILAFSQQGDEFLLAASVSDVNAGTSTTTAAAVALTAPPNTRARFHATLTSSANAQILFYSPAQSTQATGSAGNFSLAFTTASATEQASGDFAIRTNGSSQIEVVSGQSVTYYIETYGWVDRRGRDN